MLDLATMDTKSMAEEGALMEVTDPRTGDPLKDSDGNKVTITLAGMDSKRYQDGQYKIQNKRINQSIRKGRMQATIDAEDLAKENLELLVDCTLSWSGFTWRGEVLPCTAENARMLYTQLGWLREQADSFIADRQNFFRRS